MSRKFLGPLDIIRNSIVASFNPSRVTSNVIYYLPDYQGQMVCHSEQMWAFDPNIYFYKPLMVFATVQTGAISFTLGGGTRLPAAQVKAYITANGVNVPTFSSDFVMDSSSLGWQNVNGVVHEIVFTWTGNTGDVGKATYYIKPLIASAQLATFQPGVPYILSTAGSIVNLVVPTWARFVEAYLLGGAGGGGGGGRQAAGVAALGGSGGAGSGLVYVTKTRLDAIGLSPGAQFHCMAGAGGVGGSAATVDSTLGGNGIAGGFSYIRLGTSSSAGAYILYVGGGGGGTGSNGGVAATVAVATGGTGAAVSLTGGAGLNGASPVSNQIGGGGGGGSGAGVTAANVASSGGNGGFGSPGLNNQYTSAAGGGAAAAGQSSTGMHTFLKCQSGAGGGGSSTVANAGNGGIGTGGGGGGGGGASRNGFLSGAGGKGSDGRVVIIFYTD